MRIPTFWVPMLALALAACTEGWIPVNPLGPPLANVAVLSGGPQSVVIGPVRTVEDGRAKTLADSHCQQYGLNAQLPRMIDSDKVHYLCLQ